jgi:uncharacterized protein (DUF4415 family)
MRKHYDFSKGKRGALVRENMVGKRRITIRLDDAVLEWFLRKADDAGGGNYQSMINAALKEHIQREHEPLEATLRRVLREEFKRLGSKAAPP